MLQSRPFVQHVLRKPNFNRNVTALIIDETHCVSHWGSGFRKMYGTLGMARTFLGRTTPCVAMTATLTARAHRDIMGKLQIHKGQYEFINAGNDRPNVSIVVRSFEHPLNSFADLNFILPDSITDLTNILKTWVYVDEISTGEEVVDHLSRLLKVRLIGDHDPKAIDHAIGSYNAIHTPEYRQAAMIAFRNGTMRIMICTEAAGMVSGPPLPTRAVHIN